MSSRKVTHHHHVLIVGTTGSGKSSLISLVTNFVRGGSLDKLRVAIPTRYHAATEGFEHDEHDLDNGTTSKTNRCHSYTLHYRGVVWVFTDSAGFSDSRGPKQDDKNVDNIVETVAKLGSLSAILIVVDGSNGRSSSDVSNAFCRIKGILPESTKNHVMVLATKCWKESCNLQVLPAAIPKERVFYINNSFFSSEQASWSARERRRQESNWVDCMEVVQDMLDAIAAFGSRAPTEDFKRIVEQRNVVMATLHNAEIEIMNLQRVLEALDQAMLAVAAYAKDADDNKSYFKPVSYEKTKLVDASYHSTICKTCSWVYHEACGLDEIRSNGSSDFVRCSAISGSNCTNCPRRCSYSSHYHDRKTMCTYTEIETDVDTAIKARFDNATTAKSQSEERLDKLKAQKDKFMATVDELKDTLRSTCANLKRICPGYNLVDELHNTIKCLTTSAKSIQSLEARDANDQLVQCLTALCTTL